MIFFQQVGFTLPKLDVKFIHLGYGLVVENNIMGIQLKCIKSKSVEEVGESARLDVQLEFSEIYVSSKIVLVLFLSSFINVIYHAIAAQRSRHLDCRSAET